MKNLFVFGLACLLVIGCGKKATTQSIDSDATAAAQGGGDVEVREIINGARSADPSVVLYGCTATIVGPRTAITVAHCFHPSKAVNGVRNLQVKGKSIRTQFYAHPGFNGYDFDVAIGFAEEDFEVTPRPLGKQIYWGGATITGFGCAAASGAGYGTQRTGWIKLYDYYRNRYMLKGWGSVACPGDSGGPVFQGGAIVGVMSRSDMRRTTLLTRLDVPGNRNWLVGKAVSLKKTICGVHSNGCQAKETSP
jgi:hypothetical protein